jgi:transcriptional regulator with XRE-family HTH domain
MASPAPGWLACLRDEVRARVRAQGSTQAALAARVGITPSHLGRMLGGRAAGSPQLLTAIAEAVGLQIVIAIGASPPPLPPGKRSHETETEG